MEKCFVVHSPSLGDTICSTPTLRKLSKSYGVKFHVATYVPEVFFNNPYVKKIIDVDSTNKENYEIFETFINISKKDEKGISKKHNTIDIRQFHAIDLGFNLSPEEMECGFYPDIYEDLRLPSDYICIHPTQTWESRTWAKEKWQELTNELIRMGVCVVLVGKNSQEFGFWDIEKPTFDIEGGVKVINLLNKTNLSSTWNVINNASKFITMDSGLLHLAGTTDTHIIQLGSSIDHRLRAPYRKGSQEYKYDYVGGSCDISCASDIKYGIKEWGTIQGTPPLIRCLEDKSTFECHPSVDQVMNQLSKNNLKIFQNRNENKKKILYLAPHLSTGGSPEWLRKAIESIKDDFEVFVVEFSLYADLYTIQRDKIIKMIGEDKFYSLGSVFDKGETHIENRWKLIDIINEIQPDVVHINEMPEMFEYGGFPDEILSELYREDRGYKIYETSHCSVYEPEKNKRYIPDGFIHCSPLHFEQYKNFDVPQHLAEYQLEKRERPSRKETLEGLGLDPRKKHVLQVGLFTIGKNQKYTLELAEATQGLNIQYHFVGNRSFIKNCDIPDEHISLPNCKMWGERNDVDIFMSCMDILIFPSLVELNPIVLKEAASWDMNIFLNNIEAYEKKYNDDDNFTFMTLDLERDKEILNWCEFYSTRDQKDRKHGTEGQGNNFPWVERLWIDIIKDNEYQREFEIENNDLVVDIGANIGFFASVCFDKNIKKYYGLEPIKENFSCLEKNIKLAPEPEKFIIIEKAVSDAKKLYSPSSDKITPITITSGGKSDIELNVTSFRNFVEEYKIDFIDFLKIDIEGGEFSLLSNPWNLNFISNNVKKFVSELHLSYLREERSFISEDLIKEINNITTFFKENNFEIKIFSIDGLNITEMIINNYWFTEHQLHAMDYYNQIMFYANRNI